MWIGCGALGLVIGDSSRIVYFVASKILCQVDCVNFHICAGISWHMLLVLLLL